MRKIFSIVFLFFVFFQSSKLVGQDILTSKDLSTVKIDNLTENDISKIRSQLEFNNITIDQAEPAVLAKGMSAREFAKLKERLNGSASISTSKPSNLQERTQEKTDNNKIKDSTNIQVFGAELFDNPALNFEPNLKLATPLNYILGPGDEMQVSVYGTQEFSSNVPVTTEGRITLDHVGQIPVAGITIEAATQKIKTAIARIYSTVRSGQSKVAVSLSRIRTIHITVIGSRLPGNYSISSFATVFNALFLAGGPAKDGSYRNIELLRDNKLITHVDIYKFLVNGTQSENLGLKDNDVIRIPAYNQRVIIKGQVKRPGIFEMKEGETFADLLSFASGFNEDAYTASVNIIQKTSKEFRVKDIGAAEFKSYKPLSGDEFNVAKILTRFENRITLKGAVSRPGTFSFYEGMRINDLVTKADGLTPDAYTKRAVVVRLKPDLTNEIVNIDLAHALTTGDTSANILLRKEDVVTVYSILDFKEDFSVSINGEVKKPGVYQFRNNLTLNDLLIEAGGLLESSSKRVEIARMLKAEEIDDKNTQKSQLFNLDINTASNEQAKNFELQPFDVVNIRKMAVYEKPQTVTISGAVAYPGIYVIANKNEKVYDVILRAGSITSTGDINGVKIKRPIQAKQVEAIENVNLNLGQKDSVQSKLTKKLKEELKYSTIPVDLKKITDDPKDYSNITLQSGDEIEIALKNESVKVTGNVLLTSEIPYLPGKNFNYYIDAVGGMDNKGWKKKAYIIYPNGQAAVTSSFLFFRFFPKVTPGAQIVIPEKPANNKVTAGEITSIASVLVGMAGVVIAILRK